jgi:hypothetical protein
MLVAPTLIACCVCDVFFLVRAVCALCLHMCVCVCVCVCVCMCVCVCVCVCVGVGVGMCVLADQRGQFSPSAVCLLRYLPLISVDFSLHPQFVNGGACLCSLLSLTSSAIDVPLKR